MTEVYYTDITKFKLNKDFSFYESRLSVQRIEMLKKQAMLENQKQSLGAGFLLDEVLKKHGKREISEPYDTNKHGKRIYQGFDINLSHCKNIVMCAWSEQPVGIDIEKIKRYDKRIPIRFFTKKEQEWILQNTNPSRAFFQLWTRKESIAKWEGTGIGQDFFEDIVLPDEFMHQQTNINKQKVWLHSFELMDFLISVCTTEADIISEPEQIFVDI